MPVNRHRRRPTPHRLVGFLAAWLLACVGLCLGAAPAHAAAGDLQASDPGGRQELDSAPGWVNLAFEGNVDESVAKVLVLDANGKNVTSGPLIVENTNVTTQLRDDLAKGTYTVHYRVDGADGQPRGGAFQFSYGSGSFSDPPDRSWSGSAQEPEVLRGDDPNGPEQPAGNDSPGVEVTSTKKNERTTSAPAPTATTATTDEPDPDDPATEDSTQGSDDPSRSSTATAVREESGVGRAFLIGGVVLLAAVGGAAVGLYRSSKKGSHD